MFIYIMLSFCCALSTLNTFFIIFLSNAIFRFISDQNPKNKKKNIQKIDSGLVDLKNSPTYDPRFFDVK